MTVTARSIVEAINVISYLGDRQRSILVDLLLDSLLFQAAEEGFGDGIVPAVAFPAHTRLEAIRPTESPPGVAAVLGSLIGMNQRAARSSPADRHQHRVEYELAMNGRAGSPAYDQSREQIHDDGEVEPALPGADVGDIRHPCRVGPRGGELSLQQIRDEDGGFADGPAPRAIAMQCAKIGLTHQPRDAMLAAGLSRFTQIQEDPRGAIDAMARDERRSDQTKQPGVLLSPVRDRLLQPVVVAARGYLENPTQRLHAVSISIRFDELVGGAHSSRDLVLGLRHRSSSRGRMLSVH